MDIFEKLQTSTPIDKVAARVVSTGFSYTPKKRIDCADQDYPFEMKLPEENETDLTGRVVGRMKIIGKSIEKGMSKRALWVARCCCGRYTLRKSKAINNSLNKNDCCEYCRDLGFLKKSSYFKRTGKEMPEDYL